MGLSAKSRRQTGRATDPPGRRGDIALLRTTQALLASNSTGGAAAIDQAWRVLDATFKDPEWRKYGTPGIGCMVLDAAADAFVDDDKFGQCVVESIRTPVEAMLGEAGIGKDDRLPALVTGLVAAVARVREGDIKAKDAGERLVLGVLRSETLQDLRAGVEAGMRKAGDASDRLTFARAALCGMSLLLPERSEAPWRPDPDSVAWLVAGMACPCDENTALEIRQSARSRVDESQRPSAFAREDGNVSEWLFATFAVAALDWSVEQEATWRQEMAKAEQAISATEWLRWPRKIPKRDDGFDAPNVVSGKALIEHSLAMRRAGNAIAHVAGGKRNSRRRA